jgi:Protein of unknown function (DUF3800)
LAEKYIFADEAGCFTFRRGPNISKYFIVCTVTLTDLSIAQAITDLRRKMVWERTPVGECFHATTDPQPIRGRVYDTIQSYPFKIQAVICEKAKAKPAITSSKARFYKYPWFYGLKYGIAPFITPSDTVFVTVASIGDKREKKTFQGELDDVMYQTVPKAKWTIDFRPSKCDPCLQLADYCAWAIQRKWEKGDTRSYDLIKDRITNEYDLWQHGSTLHY